jgi:hypothetical protein
MAWIKHGPSADGKSPVAGSWEPTPRSTIAIARLRISTFFLLHELRPVLHAMAGEGKKGSTDP